MVRNLKKKLISPTLKTMRKNFEWLFTKVEVTYASYFIEIFDHGLQIIKKYCLSWYGITHVLIWYLASYKTLISEAIIGLKICFCTDHTWSGVGKRNEFIKNPSIVDTYTLKCSNIKDVINDTEIVLKYLFVLLLVERWDESIKLKNSFDIYILSLINFHF